MLSTLRFTRIVQGAGRDSRSFKYQNLLCQMKRGDNAVLTHDFHVTKRRSPPFSQQSTISIDSVPWRQRTRGIQQRTSGRPLRVVNFKGVFPDLFCGFPHPYSLVVYNAVTIQRVLTPQVFHPPMVIPTILLPH